MKKQVNNYAFIDAQNLHLGIQRLGWKMDWRRFRVYLAEKYGVTVAYLFIGFIPRNQELYARLQRDGYVLVFKPTVPDGHGNVKGNVDADLILRAMIDFSNYERAIIVTSDGDFYSLVEHLYKHGKLEKVISPYKDTCSVLLRRSAREKIVFIANLREKLEDKKRHRLRTEPRRGASSSG